jgi:HD-GYP domain-containing protein (c-di-GMP phosphodiesterase class II)
VYFLLNSWLMATAVGFEQAVSPLDIWRQNFLWLSLSFLSGASVSILLVSVSREINLNALAVIIPLLVISYLTYHTSMARVEDANRHVAALNRLYLSTIETLAMAIDAKDQITHGHIRRVQEHSVTLARQMGVNEEHLIKAIEAASLLHDMGKLAVPEHILNKPGKTH